jgi:DegV family protein with EDD domain
LLKTVETSVSFVIPADFNFLKRSGRLTPLAAKIGAMIKIVPVLTQTEDGKKITPFTIKRSWKKATDAILEKLEALEIDEEYRIYICHGGDLKNAELVMEQTKQRFPKVEIAFMSLSPTMITHGGPGCVLLQAIKK